MPVAFTEPLMPASFRRELLALFFRPDANRANRCLDPPGAGFRLLRSLDRLRILTLVGVTQLSPPMPCRRRCLQSADEIGRWLHLARFRVEFKTDLKRLTTF